MNKPIEICLGNVLEPLLIEVSPDEYGDYNFTREQKQLVNAHHSCNLNLDASDLPAPKEGHFWCVVYEVKVNAHCQNIPWACGIEQRCK